VRPTSQNSKAITAEIDARIRARDLRPGQAIPPIRELCQKYGVAPMTVRRALAPLYAQGKLRTEPGIGVFVSDRCPLEGVVFLTTFRENVARPWWVGNPEPHLAGAKEACSELGIPLISAGESDNPSLFLNRGYGFLLNIINAPDSIEFAPWITAIVNSRAPHMHLNVDRGSPNFIGPDFAAGVGLALRHFRSLGHRRIALVPRWSHGTGQPIFSHVGVPEAEGLDITLHSPRRSGEDGPAAIQQSVTAALKEALNHPRPPTAFLVGNCGHVAFAMQGLHDLGLRPPHDCSVIGFCREIFAEWNGRRVTRVDNPRRRAAKLGVYEMVRMAATPGYNPGRVLVKPDFFDGDTCASLEAAKAREPALAASTPSTQGECT